VSTWAHRVMRRKDKAGASFGIHEVYFADDGHAEHWTKGPIEAAAGTLKGLRWTLRWMTEALDEPVLDHKTGKEWKKAKQ